MQRPMVVQPRGQRMTITDTHRRNDRWWYNLVYLSRTRADATTDGAGSRNLLLDTWHG